MWGICPYFPSGTFIASDMQSGLYVYRPTRNYGILKVAVIDGATSTPAAGVTVLLSTQGDSLTTPADGIVRFAASPGPQTVEVRRFGYVDVSATRNVVTGVSDSVTLVLDKQPTTHLSGVVRDATTLAPTRRGRCHALLHAGHAAHQRQRPVRSTTSRTISTRSRCAGPVTSRS